MAFLKNCFEPHKDSKPSKCSLLQEERTEKQQTPTFTSPKAHNLSTTDNPLVV